MLCFSLFIIQSGPAMFGLFRFHPSAGAARVSTGYLASVSPSQCIAACRAAGHPVAAMAGGGECSCMGADYAAGGRKGDFGDAPCDHDAGVQCGGVNEFVAFRAIGELRNGGEGGGE
eukprot:GHVU01188919.1.p2 GENE.GHVU01188919.1~~GHVU01188919.1.p2  ORF type:complete len:117 (+),score=22.55 GHVU01188919.1:398-748(+)